MLFPKMNHDEKQPQAFHHQDPYYGQEEDLAWGEQPDPVAYDPAHGGTVDQREDPFLQQQQHPTTSGREPTIYNEKGVFDHDAVPGTYDDQGGYKGGGGGGGGENHFEQPGTPEDFAQEQAPPPQRQFKYSTANMNEEGRCRKYTKIILLFLLFLGFMIGLSMLMQHFFFGDESDNGPGIQPRNDNGTFPLDKQEVDSACSRGIYQTDNGLRCREACDPVFFECCDPFDEFDLYNVTVNETTVFETDDDMEGRFNPDDSHRNSTDEANGNNSNGKENTNTTDMEDNTDEDIPTNNGIRHLDRHDDAPVSVLEQAEENQQCTFDQDVRGCMSYAKCQAIGGQADPAPSTLPEICSLEQLEKDPEGCHDLCRKVECCYSANSDNCLAQKFDICMDYAPCQNLRPYVTVETAPRTLDYDCYWQQIGCFQTCEKAECCGQPMSSCFRDNFLSCLTYAPCTAVTTTKITIQPQFNYLPQPPAELIYACNAHKETVLEPTPKTCAEYCEAAACCWNGNQDENCFHNDPLGCIAWEAQCQMLLDHH
jgi:hypothetical protein